MTRDKEIRMRIDTIVEMALANTILACTCDDTFMETNDDCICAANHNEWQVYRDICFAWETARVIECRRTNAA